MSPQEKLTMRNEFAAIFNDIQDSVLRTLYDMPRPLLMILRLVWIVFLSRYLVIVCLFNNSLSISRLKN